MEDTKELLEQLKNNMANIVDDCNTAINHLNQLIHAQDRMNTESDKKKETEH